jgi:hypothetical protein
MKGSAKRKCLCCGEFYPPDHRNLRQQRYCPKPACRKESKAQSQRRWQQRPENQNYFRSPENCERVKDWRKRNPAIGAKRSLQPKDRYKMSSEHNQLKMKNLLPKGFRMRYKISSRCNRLSLWDLSP